MKRKQRLEKRKLRKLKKHTNKLMELTKEKLEISSVLGAEMEQYDPDEGPDPKEWLEMDEASRILLIETYHEEQGLSLGDPGAKERNKMHAVLHAVVETQVALGLECAAGQALYRLEDQGLSRHEAIHAIGMVFSEHIWTVAKRDGAGPSADDYEKEVATLTIEKVREMQDRASET